MVANSLFGGVRNHESENSKKCGGGQGPGKNLGAAVVVGAAMAHTLCGPVAGLASFLSRGLVTALRSAVE